MNRRQFCAAAGAGVLLAGCKNLAKPQDEPVRVFIITATAPQWPTIGFHGWHGNCSNNA